VYGDDINTDVIIPGRYLDNYDATHLASHAMEGIDKEFSKKVSRGDIIVAGRNFGCGSSREQAVIALKTAGVSAVVAKSFARIFYRNAVNLGLPVVVSSTASEVVRGGATVVLDIDAGRLSSEGGSKIASVEPVPPHVKRILDAGGLVPYLKLRLRTEGTNKNV
jgi:3-isopropylmalate/(R)-2-methylmalate dehydratase small subunit